MEATEKEEISVEDEAVDKNIFKECSNIAFYRRQKQWLSKKSPYRASLDSVTTGKDSTSFQIIDEATKVICKFSPETTVLALSPGMQGYL
ncbi:neutral alpha-glucosidase C isoform X5 [Loxodonta africana]|uniref:neutral alpha-glucosidase C isoform X7 n=1 Tax=Elephas maximus indicus TaxID=99487 RepID=UPI002117227F|nr:neutral alpha-glucosidase C isoform X7 [Elephas maximus indicus]